MCGIVGILGREPVAPSLVEALKRLEYRGYDSAGIATLEKGKLTRLRASGKLRNLEEKLAAAPLLGTSGIGHTRWATHGRPTETNAHPHTSGGLAVVHNGIIENFRELREELTAKGHVFATETDIEVVAHLVAEERGKGACSARGRGRRAGAARWRFRPRLPLRGRGGSADRRAPRRAAGGRLGETAKSISAPTLWRSRPSPKRSPISRRATMSC